MVCHSTVDKTNADIPSQMSGANSTQSSKTNRSYMVYSNKLSIVLEHHDLISRISRFLGILPVIDCHLCGFRAVLARNMEYPASCNVLSVAQTLLAYAAGAVGVGIRRSGPGAEPRYQVAQSDGIFRIANDKFYQASPPRLDRENGFTRKDMCGIEVVR